ncbi:hypothetical protein ARMGADRAFT_454091 [Armillaria gallica]|uniref:Uncharacterized protein n=1 Tax=Armillaria gallica TaxID=47427 RepID=A0A2H3CXJ6_ARMGA|nr:hypothetical protein ARMGADRAFT_454091 [Armillaria gallica]
MSLRSSDSKGEAPLQWRFPLTIQKPRKQSQALQTVVREPCGQVLGIESPWQASWYMPSAPRMPFKHQYQSIRSPVQDSEYTNPRPKTQERERGDRRMAREDDRHLDSACGRPLAIGWKLRSETSIIAPTVIEDYIHACSPAKAYVPVMSMFWGTESPPRVVAPHQWGGSRKGIRHRAGGAR